MSLNHQKSYLSQKYTTVLEKYCVWIVFWAFSEWLGFYTYEKSLKNMVDAEKEDKRGHSQKKNPDPSIHTKKEDMSSFFLAIWQPYLNQYSNTPNAVC